VPLEILHRAAPCRNVPVNFTLDLMKRSELLAHFDRYDAITRYFGSPDESSLAEVRKIVSALRGHAAGNLYVQEKLGGMLEWAEIGLSTRKFQRHGGVEQVRVFAMTEAENAQDVLLRQLGTGE
jgi:hypothetical protein